MTELERVYEGEVVENWREDLINAYIAYDENVTEAKWKRAEVAYAIVARSHETGDIGLLSSFAGEVRRSSSHLKNEAFAWHLRLLLESVGQPIAKTLTPTYSVEAAKGRRKAIESGDEEAVKEVGEILAKAEDEHWTAATTRQNAKGKTERVGTCPECGVVFKAQDADIRTEEARPV